MRLGLERAPGYCPVLLDTSLMDAIVQPVTDRDGGVARKGA
jgi:hypothetical protein